MAIPVALKEESVAVGVSLASVQAAAAQELPLPPTAALAVAAALIVPPVLPVVREGNAPMPAPAAVVLERDALAAGESPLPYTAAGGMAKQVKWRSNHLRGIAQQQWLQRQPQPQHQRP